MMEGTCGESTCYICDWCAEYLAWSVLHFSPLTDSLALDSQKRQKARQGRTPGVQGTSVLAQWTVAVAVGAVAEPNGA